MDSLEEKTIEEMEKELKECLENYFYEYDTPNEKSIIKKIYDLFINHKIDKDCDDADYLNYLGFFYYSIKEKPKIAIKYYKMAIEKKQIFAMHNLGQLYEEEHDYKSMKKYYLMAIENGYAQSMTSLGHFYYRKDKFDNMKKYFLMGIENGESHSMYYLGSYYLENDDLDQAIKYFEMAVEKKNYNGYLELAMDYEEKEDYNKSKEFYIKYLENEESTGTASLTVFSLINLVIKHNEDIDFVLPFCAKFEVDTTQVDEYKIKRSKRVQFMNNKKKFNKIDFCNVCYEDNKELVIFDCFAHYICERCYNSVEKCPYCNIEKHQIMINKLDDDEDNDDDDEEESEYDSDNDAENNEDNDTDNDEDNDTEDSDDEDSDDEDSDIEENKVEVEENKVEVEENKVEENKVEENKVNDTKV